MIAHESFSAEDIGKILKVSRGSISTNMRALTSSSMTAPHTLFSPRRPWNNA